MTHKEVQAIMGKEPQLFKKTEFDIYMTEQYIDICHIYYDGSVCVAFEFNEPSHVYYDNIQLISQEKKNLENLFGKLDDYEWKSDSLSAFGGDFSVWGQYEQIESVYISRRGYFAEQYEYYLRQFDEKYKN
jgi:hypothetical protein